MQKNLDSTFTIFKLDTIGKLRINSVNGARLFESKESGQVAKMGSKHRIKAAFIGRDQAELKRNLALAEKQKEKLSGGEVEILRINQEFPFSSTEIRGAFQGKFSIAYLWAIDPTTLVYIANIAEKQESGKRLYDISDEVLAKMLVLRDKYNEAMGVQRTPEVEAKTLLDYMNSKFFVDLIAKMFGEQDFAKLNTHQLVRLGLAS